MELDLVNIKMFGLGFSIAVCSYLFIYFIGSTIKNLIDRITG
ncbi:MAG: hypothetical protein RR557_07085 [Bacilli bacterium]